jgi:uncharacterized protein YuzE
MKVRLEVHTSPEGVLHLYLRLKEGAIARTLTLDDWALVDVDADGNVVGIEVPNVSAVEIAVGKPEARE